MEAKLPQRDWPAGTCLEFQHRNTAIRSPDKAIDRAPDHDRGILEGKRHLKEWFAGL